MLVVSMNLEQEVLKLTIGNEIVYITLHEESTKRIARYVICAGSNVKITREKRDDSVFCRE
jgi:hypothetical protein